MLRKIGIGVVREVKQFQIRLFTPPDYIYNPGDVIEGSLTLHVSSDKNLSLELILYGSAIVRWSEGGGKHVQSYENEEDFFKLSSLLTVSAQQTEYPFKMEIPNIASLPWSATFAYGYVKYGIDAIVKTPGFITPNSNKVNVQFLLHSKVHPRLVPSSRNQDYYMHASTAEIRKLKTGWYCVPLCCCYYCGKNKIKLELQTMELWTYPGKEIRYIFTIDNTKSERVVQNVKIQLIGLWICRGKQSLWCNENPVTEMEKDSRVCAEIIHPISVAPGERITSQGGLNVPNVIPSQVECNVLRLVYKLKAQLMQISGSRGCCNKGEDSVQVDVVIGTEIIEN